MTAHFIEPDWPAPQNVLALSTTRIGGSSRGIYTGLNLGDHVGDLAESVEANRRLLLQYLPDGCPVQWLNQVHGVNIVRADPVGRVVDADGSYTRQPGVACAVLTADCLPILICNQSGDCVAAVHAGWRGLSQGVLEHCVASMNCPVESLMAWLGPAIGPAAFEVGGDVRTAFLDTAAPTIKAATGACFTPAEGVPGHYMANLPELARVRLRYLGLRSIYGGQNCTFSDSERFYSYRRDGQTGRMVSLIMIKSCQKPLETP